MGGQFAYSVELQSDPDTVWTQVMKPALFLHVAAPLVQCKPLGFERFPEKWEAAEYRCDFSLFGVLPIGWQVIGINLPEPVGETRVLIDAGHSPILKEWNHRIEVAPRGTGTLYTDSVSLDAGALSPLAGAMVKQFFKHRQRRLRALDASGFVSLEG